MKSLLNPEDAEGIIKRGKMLQANLLPKWGSMNVTEMLHHCNKATDAILQGKGESKKSTLKQKIIRFLFLNVIRKFPKNANAPERFNIKKRQLKPDEFEVELENYIKLATKFTKHKEPIIVSHPYFGKLSTKEWGVFTWMHLDHHLRQFGL
jgi:hypothetical protein